MSFEKPTLRETVPKQLKVALLLILLLVWGAVGAVWYVQTHVARAQSQVKPTRVQAVQRSTEVQTITYPDGTVTPVTEPIQDAGGIYMAQPETVSPQPPTIDVQSVQGGEDNTDKALQMVLETRRMNSHPITTPSKESTFTFNQP